MSKNYTISQSSGTLRTTWRLQQFKYLAINNQVPRAEQSEKYQFLTSKIPFCKKWFPTSALTPWQSENNTDLTFQHQKVSDYGVLKSKYQKIEKRFER